MKLSPSVLALIGNTPILKLTKFDTGPCELFLKLENHNPGGSVKDRAALAMVEAAEDQGRIKPGDTLIEATTGNTGLGLCLVAMQKGYSLILVVPENVNREKVLHMKACGAEVRLARSDVEPGHPDHYRNIARRLEKELPGSFYLNQFNNPANPRVHEEQTAPEIWQQMEQKLDALVVGAGSGGTLSGCARFLKKADRGVDVVLADPAGSILAGTFRNEPPALDSKPILVEDIGGRSVPDNLDLGLVDDAYTIPDHAAFSTMHDLLRLEGILGGASTGVQLEAALRYCRKQEDPKRVVTLALDTGHKYLATGYDQTWLLDQGLVARPQYGDLRDLIMRRADQGEVVSVAPEDTLLTAYTRIRMFDVSQLPVLEDQRIVGMIDESDLLMAVFDNRSYFDYPVRDFMITRLETVKPGDSIASLLPVFRGDHVAIIAEGDTFYGLVTQIDLINSLRNSMSNHS